MPRGVPCRATGKIPFARSLRMSAELTRLSRSLSAPHPRRHDQDPDPVPSRHRPGAAAISRSRHQCGPAPVAARAPERDPGRAAPTAPSQDPAATPSGRAVWQAGVTRPLLPHDLPPLRLLLVWDNLTGHKTPTWCCGCARMALCPSTRPWAAAGSTWRNDQRVLKRRALDGQHPHSPAEIGSWFEQTAQPGMSSRPRFVDGKRRQRRCRPVAIKPIGSAALGHARPDRFVETVQLEHQNARSHGNRPTSSACRLVFVLARTALA